MGKKCYVPKCNTGYKTCKEKFSLFKVPKDKIELWQRKIPRFDRPLTEKDRICEKHFSKDFIIREINTELWTYPLKLPKLSEDAVPTIFPGFPKYMTKEVRKRKVIIRKPLVAVKQQKLHEIEAIFLDEADISSNPPFFNNLLNKTISIELPSTSWGFHIFKNLNKRDEICIAEITCVDGNGNNEAKVIISKKIILKDDGNIQYFIFEREIKDHANLTSKIINSPEELQEVLLIFDGLLICYGGKRFEKNPNFTNASYFRDYNLDVWRHQNCTFIIENDSKQCEFCSKNDKAIAQFNFKSKLKSNRPGKMQLMRNELRNTRRREIRLKVRALALFKELHLSRQRIRNMEKTFIFNNTS